MWNLVKSIRVQSNKDPIITEINKKNKLITDSNEIGSYLTTAVSEKND